MSKFTHAGVSTLNGKTKVRFANGIDRVKILVKNGHTDLDIVELPKAMSKVDTVEYLLSIDFDNGNKVVRQALEDAQEKRAPKQPKAKKAKAKVEAVEPAEATA
jgi:hypothetical protein